MYPRPPHMTESLGIKTDVPGDRRADEHHANAYVTTGLLLVLYGLVPAGWTAYTLIVRDTPIEDFLLAVVWPSEENHVLAMTPYEWAFAVALIVVGCVALARRRVARGGALLFAIALVALSLREVVGLLDSAYRAAYFASDEGPWLLATRLSGLLVGAVVLTLMLRAKDERDARQGSSLLLAAGVVMAIAGALRLAAVVVQPESALNYLVEVVDPTGSSPARMAGSVTFYHATITVALIVGAVLALTHRRIARGLGLALLPVAGYATLQAVVPLLEFVPLHVAFDDFPSGLYVGSELLTVLAAVVGIPLLALAARQRPEPPLDPAAFAPLPGHLGQQDTGRD